MSSDRDKILSSIKSALEPLPERSPYPEWSDDLPVSKHLRSGLSLKELFAERLQAASGQYFDSVDGVVGMLASGEQVFGYCDS